MATTAVDRATNGEGEIGLYQKIPMVHLGVSVMARLLQALPVVITLVSLVEIGHFEESKVLVRDATEMGHHPKHVTILVHGAIGMVRRMISDPVPLGAT